jgi:hypothetical protein
MSLKGLAAAAAAWLALLATPACAQAPSPFADWAAVFVAGDWRGHQGGATEAFDNARRDLAEAFVAAGFAPQNLRQFSVRPERYAETAPLASDIGLIRDTFAGLARQAPAGCLFYITSHGSPQGALVGDRLLSPQGAARLIDDACGERPTVAVISACYSGVFVSELAGPNRLVMTAARPDRSSFGCGESDRYPYFDACVLESLPRAADFAVLARATGACISRREIEERLTPASEPQVALGGELRPVLPLLVLKKP